MMIKKIIILTIGIMSALTISAQNVHNFIEKQMETYPKSRLLDIYKSCFQDYMGAEHLVPNRQVVEKYLNEELSSVSLGQLLPWYYEHCGVDGRYVRVSLRTVKEGVISDELLLDAFIRGANKETPSLGEWKERWRKIIGVIEQMNLVLPRYDADKLFIDSILSIGKYAISHSPDYREAYRPHYRIVEKGIFEREIKPLIESKAKIADDEMKRLWHGFSTPQDTARTKVWWFHGQTETTREGITADLEAFKRQGVGGVVFYNQVHGKQTGRALRVFSPEWWQMFVFAAKEAKRLGLTFETHISDGYVAGGPWITPDLGMQMLVVGDTVIEGGRVFDGTINLPEDRKSVV